MSAGPRVVVLGFMGACPIAGVLWQHLHFIEAVKRAGCDVWYVEDTARYPYDPETFDSCGDYRYAARTIATMMERLDLTGKWGYVARHLDEGGSAGLPLTATLALLREADALLNVCGSHEMTPELAAARCLIYVESDPGVEQIKVAKGEQKTREFLKQHDWLFTFGEWVPTPEFPVPVGDMVWHPTRQPVVVDFWAGAGTPTRDAHTTIANWSTSGLKDIEWEGEHYLWSKSLEFLKFQSVPRLAGVPVEMACDVKPEETARGFEADGWRLVSPHGLSIGMERYRDYIRSSRGEFTVAKDQYVRLRTGWFSDRSACYLAAGRPVVTQETGFSAALGNPLAGLLGFTTVNEAVERLREVEADYARHSAAAEEIAREFFEGEKVLRALLGRVGIL